jgi:hypothetical protein
MKEVNPYESPSVDQPAGAAQPADAAGRRDRDVQAVGCLLAFVSLLVFITLQDGAIVDSMRLWRGGHAWLAGVVQLAPLACLMAWLIVFHTPIGKRSRLMRLRAVRFIPVLARHVVLWVALTGVALLFHFVSSR